MQVIAVIRRLTETFSPEEFAPILEPEAQAVRAHYEAGRVRDIWSREDALGAVVLFETDSIERAHEIIAALPLVQNEMAEVQMVIPVRGYRGFYPRT